MIAAHLSQVLREDNFHALLALALVKLNATELVLTQQDLEAALEAYPYDGPQLVFQMRGSVLTLQVMTLERALAQAKASTVPTRFVGDFGKPHA